ncbi:DUF4292 domain-containing protein [Spirosoma sp. BT702]|uniref:DUF4292 domain-containing protein n=1 Tax=Spirosoma profusum TaxID=2771354 RepID=A0A926XXE0_9BACT|nr:DUF4292 domain-containing protein [Spirosoma profusum]MBD2702414.1 DUF4292 domain-containing protein [Spirosoma profusum]
MKKQLITFVALVALPVLTFAQTADEIIEKNIAATGGADKIAAVKTFQFDQSISIMGMDMTGKSTVVVDKSIRNDVTVMGQQMTTVVDGDKGWTINPMQGGTSPQPLPDDQLKTQKGNMHLFGTDLFVAKDKKYPIEFVGKEKLGDKDVFNLKVTRPEGVANYFIDATTYQIAGMNAKVTLQGQTSDIKIKYGNYKPMEGLNLPTSLDLENPSMPGPLTITVSNVVFNPKVDPAIFAMPK